MLGGTFVKTVRATFQVFCVPLLKLGSAVFLVTLLNYFNFGCAEKSTISGNIGSAGPQQLATAVRWDSSDADDGTSNSNSWQSNHADNKWNIAYGESNGGYRTECFSNGGGCVLNSYIWKRFAWTDFGIPILATVDSVGDASGDTSIRYSLTTTSGLTTYTVGPIDIYDGTNTTFIGRLMTSAVFTTNTSGFVTHSSGNQVAMASAATDEFVIRIETTVSVDPLTLGTGYIYLDNFTFPIDHTIP